ncbi:MAG: hypothetical protein F4X98_19075 [Gammaproteobacteria bacterium]|nr:hypothetical protein [Gammaproteobacteria bacterium]
MPAWLLKSAILVAVVVLAAAAVMFAGLIVKTAGPGDAESPSETRRSDPPPGQDAGERLEPAARPNKALSAAALIDDPECSLQAGKGPASGVALLIVADGDKARFQVRDQGGILFGDELPFVPGLRSMGRQADGRVVVVLGDMKVHERDSQTPELYGPARVYWDGQIIYEHEKLWEFGVARDGSSFFVIEPLAGETSRLVVRNLDEMAEHHFDLGRRMTHFGNHGRAYGVYYSSGMSEVVFGHAQELNDSPVGDYWFYPNDGGTPRVVRIRSADVPPRSGDAVDELDPRQVRDEPILRGGVMRRYPDRVHFVSSETAYHLVDQGGYGSTGTFEVRKSVYQGYGEDEGPRRSDVWSWKVRGSDPRGLTVSDNGNWVAVEDRYRTWALNVHSGELVLAFPTTEELAPQVPPDGPRLDDPVVRRSYTHLAYERAALARLRPVLGSAATLADLGSRGGYPYLLGDRLLLRRSIGRGVRSRGFYDVFDLTTAGVDGPPLYRRPANQVPPQWASARGDCRLTADAVWSAALDR